MREGVRRQGRRIHRRGGRAQLTADRIAHPNTVIGAATVQEEVGLRGARTSAYVVQPDVCITLEVDIAGDVPGIEAHEAPTKMGLVRGHDLRCLPDPQPGSEGVPDPHGGGVPDSAPAFADERRGTDGGAIHMANAGCPSVVVTVPTRHIHSHVGMLSLEDVDNAVALLVEVVKRLDAKTAESFIAI